MPPIVNNSRLSQTEKTRLRVSENSPLMLRVGELFNRNESTLWTIGETESLSQIGPSDKELTLIKNYYTAVFPEDKDYRRRKLQTLLNNRNGELDKAEAWGREEHKRFEDRLLRTTERINEATAQIQAIEAQPKVGDFDSERRCDILKRVMDLRITERFLTCKLESWPP